MKLRAVVLSSLLLFSALTSGGMLAQSVTAQTSGNTGTLVVDVDGGAEYRSIQDAVDNASEGATVEVRPGIYEEPVDIEKNLTLAAPDGATIANTSAVAANYGSINARAGLQIFGTATPQISGFTVIGWQLGVSAGSSERGWVLQDTIIQDGHLGVGGAGTGAAWTVDNVSIHNVDIGVSGYGSSGAWTVRNSAVTNASTGVLANESLGDWTVEQTVLEDIDDAVMVGQGAAGDWTVARSLIRNAASDGVAARIAIGNWTIQSTTIVNATRGVDAAETSGYWEIHDSRFLNNTDVAVNALGAARRGNATYNYWAAPDGPSGDFAGSGGAAFGNVRVSPFYSDVNLTSPATFSDGSDSQPTPAFRVESTDVGVGNTTTVRANLTAVPTGVSAYLVNVSVGNGSVGRITNASIGSAFEQTLEGNETYRTVIDETNTTVTLAAQDIREQVGPGATNVTLGTITLEGQTSGGTTLIPETDNQYGVQNESRARITPTLTSGLLTVTADTTDSSGTDTGDSTTEPQVDTGRGGGGGSDGSSDDSAQVTVDTSTATETDSGTETETDPDSEPEDTSETRDIEVSVRDPDPDQPVDVDLEPTDSDNDADLTGLSVDVASSEDFSIRAAASAQQPADAPEFTPQEAEATEPLSYVDIDASVPNSAIDEANVDFRVSKDRLASMENTDANDIVVYRHGTDEYEEVPIQQTRETGDFVYYRASASGFSEWTVGAKQPRFEVLRAAVDVESVTVGDSVNVIVRITNTGGADGDFLAELLLNEEVVDSREVFIAPNGTSQVTFDREFGETGTYRVRVNNASAGQVEVQDAAGSGATDATTNGTQTTENSSSSGIGGPPINPIVALLALVVVAAAVSYRLRQA